MTHSSQSSNFQQIGVPTFAAPVNAPVGAASSSQWDWGNPGVVVDLPSSSSGPLDQVFASVGEAQLALANIPTDCQPCWDVTLSDWDGGINDSKSYEGLFVVSGTHTPEGQDVFDPWQGKRLPKVPTPVPTEVALGGYTATGNSQGFASPFGRPHPQAPANSFFPTQAAAEDLESASKAPPPASSQSAWLRPELDGARDEPYDPRKGNQAFTSTENETLNSIWHENRKVDKDRANVARQYASAFQKQFELRADQPQTEGYLSPPCQPALNPHLKVGTALGGDEAESLPVSSHPQNANWSKGLDHSAKMLNFMQAPKQLCNYCKNECELPPCATCGTNVCIECYESGQHHEICAGNNHHNSWIARGNIPSEPTRGRQGVKVDYLFGQDSPAMRDILVISKVNQQRISDAKAEKEEKDRKSAFFNDSSKPQYRKVEEAEIEENERERREAKAAAAAEIYPADSVSQFAPASAPARKAAPSAEPSLLTGTAPLPPSMPPLNLGPPEIKLPRLFTGKDTCCPACTQVFENSQEVSRLQCRHAFHSKCWKAHVASTAPTSPECIACCGPGVIIARWEFIGIGTNTQDKAPETNSSRQWQKAAPNRLNRGAQLYSLSPRDPHGSQDESTPRYAASDDPSFYSIEASRSRSCSRTRGGRSLTPSLGPGGNMQFLSERQLSCTRTKTTRFSFPDDGTALEVQGTIPGPSPRLLPIIQLGQNAPASPVRLAETVVSDTSRCVDTTSHFDALDTLSAGGSTMFPVNPATAEDAQSWIGDDNSDFTLANPQQGAWNKGLWQPVIPEKGSYLTKHELPNGRIALMLDIGAVGNLAGDRWMHAMTKLCMNHKRLPEQVKREQPVNVCGVGNGSQTCTHNVHMPIAFKHGEGYSKANFKSPTVPNSDLPALLGLQSIKNMRGIVDTFTMRLHLCGPGDYDLEKVLPPGTKTIQCHHANTGHMMMPCDFFAELDSEEREGGLTIPELAMHTNDVRMTGCEEASKASPKDEPNYVVDSVNEKIVEDELARREASLLQSEANGTPHSPTLSWSDVEGCHLEDIFQARRKVIAAQRQLYLLINKK